MLKSTDENLIIWNYIPTLRGTYGVSKRVVSCPLLLKASAITALSNNVSSVLSGMELNKPKVQLSSGRSWMALSRRFLITYKTIIIA